MKIDFDSLTIQKTREALFRKEFSVRELITASLLRIKERNGDIHAYLEIFPDALEEADKADERLQNGDPAPLLGIPFAIKDNILISGKESTSGSKILSGFKAPYDATVISLLKKAGAIFVGRTNMDEFAMGSSTENSAFGATKNPHDITRVPGGSSGGSAAALAMGGVLGALGSDTGGSIRQPASFTGVVGFKGTYGSVSRYGLMALASSFDQIGPFAKNVSDAELIHNIISAHDAMDSTSIPESLRKNKRKEKGIIGVPRDFLKEGVDAEVLENFESSLVRLQGAGYTLKDITLPNVKASLAVYYVLMPAEASSNLARYDGIRYGLSLQGENSIASFRKTRGEGFGREVRRRIILGTYVLSAGYYDAYYKKASDVRELITKDFEKAFEGVDAIATPTSPFPAFPLGEKASDPLAMYLADIFTVPANLARLPAISIPSGKTKTNLPLGLHLVAPRFGEDILFSMGKKFETTT